jgi:hypothetical protein
VRTAHFAAFDAALKARIPELASLTYDGDAPLENGQPLRKTYLVEHDMGFDGQDDDRLAAETADAADGTYRVIVRVVAVTRTAVRDVADSVKTALVGHRLTIAGRSCGAIAKDPGPDGIERDDAVAPPLLYVDLDFVWRSSRA